MQLGFSDVNATQAFCKTGTAAINRTPGTAGYGKGNPYLQGTGNGVGQGGNGRQQLVDESVLNQGGRTGGTAELDNKVLAIQATLFTANPGTGLTKLNRGDAQWLQSAGRLQNGADFNMTTRDGFSGTRNVAALSTGVDPSWASGENDAGSGLTAGTQIGPNLKFSNKTAGGGLLRPTVQNARMAVGTLSISDGAGSSFNTGSRPLRALQYADSDTDAGASSTSTATGSSTVTTQGSSTASSARTNASSATSCRPWWRQTSIPRAPASSATPSPAAPPAGRSAWLTRS